MLREEIPLIFDMEEFLQDMVDRGLLEDLSGQLEYDVEGMCHNACAWMALRLNRLFLGDEMKQFFVVSGSYKRPDFCGTSVPNMEHSWIEYESDDGTVVIDMTQAQFSGIDGIYVGARTDKYNEWSRVCFADKTALVNLLESV